MSYIKLKKKLIKTISKLDRLDENKVDILNIKNHLIQYVIFCEELESKLSSNSLKIRDVESELKIIYKYLKTIEKIL